MISVPDGPLDGLPFIDTMEGGAPWTVQRVDYILNLLNLNHFLSFSNFQYPFLERLHPKGKCSKEYMLPG